MGTKSYLLGIGFSFFMAVAGVRGGTLQVSPTNQTIISGSSAQFTAIISGDVVQPVSFSWTGSQGLFLSSGQTITVSNAGKYSVTVTDAQGQQFGAACATLNVKMPPTVRATNYVGLNCALTQTSVIAATSALTPSYSWTGPGVVSGSTNATAWVNLPGTYTVTVTALNGCTASASVVVGQDLTVPLLSVATPDVLTCTKTTIVLRASATNVSYHWSGPGIVAGTNSANCTVDQPGVYTVTATAFSYFAYGLQSTGTIIVHTNVYLDAFDTNSSYIFPTNFFPGYDTNLYGISGPIYTNLYPPGGIIYPYSSPCPDVPYGANIDQNGVTNYVIPGDINGAIVGTTVSVNGQFQFFYDLSLTVYPPYGANGCSATAMVVVERNDQPLAQSPTEDLQREGVTLNQNVWGNPSARINKITIKDLRRTLLLNPTNLASAPLVVGKPGRSLTITSNAVSWLDQRLPAMGKACALPDFGNQTLRSTDGQTTPGLPLTKNGRFDNRLLGEVIALGFNLRMDADLSQFVLASTFCTQRAIPGNDHLIGTEDDQLDLLGPDRILNSGDEIAHYTIAPAVFDAMCDAHLAFTVEGLFDLANQALAGQATGSATITDICTAVQTVNEAFGGGAFCVPCP